MSLGIALENAKAGRLVFPVRIIHKSGGKADKVPLIKWGSGATCVEAQVRRLWAEFSGAATGVVTGRGSDLYVVDVDRPDALTESGLDLTFGRSVPTRREGGEHYWFASPTDGRTVPNSADGGLDVRGDGGYVVCWQRPPTGTLAPLPDDVAEWARSRRREVSSAGELPETIPEGSRETYLVSLAGSMRARGAGLTAITAALLAENAEKCIPPLEPEDIDRIAGSVSGYVAGKMPTSNSDKVLAALTGRKKRQTA